jgi:predicted DCC family thiol-disulfide oxidoreductase YuxK
VSAKPTADGNYNIFSPSYWLGELDLRPLGFMRLVFGGVLFLSVADVGPVLFAFLSDDSVMPRAPLLNGLVRPNRISVFDAAGPQWILVVLFCVTLLALACFSLGYRTRLANITAFVLVCGLHERNLMAFDGSDNVIRVMLFWMIFMPSGARYSIDAVLKGARGEKPLLTYPALPMRIGQLQIAWVYLNTIIHKWPGQSWHNGTALHIGLGLDHLFTRTLGKLIFNVPWMIHLGTHFTVALEMSFLPLVFLPVFKTKANQTSMIWGVIPFGWFDKQKPRTQRIVNLAFQPTYKALAIAGGTAMHLGIATMMSVGNFSYIMISSYFLLWEREWIVALVAALGRFWRWLYGGSVLKVLYDGECGLCTRVARTLRGLDPFGNLDLIDFRQREALAGLPSGVSLSSIGMAALEKRMHVVTPSGKVEAGYRGAVALARRIPALAPLGLIGSLPGAPLLGDPVYDRVAERRTQLHVKCDENCAVPDTGDSLWRDLRAWLARLVPRSLKETGRSLLFVALAFLAASCCWFSMPADLKILDRPVGPDSQMPRWLFFTIQELELWQKWDMFSPNPMDTDIYLMGRGTLTDGKEVDVLRGDEHGGPLPPIYPEFFFSRWTKYVNNLAYAGQPWLLEFGRYICRHWNYNPPTGRPALNTFKIFREQRRVPDLGAEPVPWGEEMIWEHHCFDSPAVASVAAAVADGGTPPQPADAGTAPKPDAK